VSGVSGEKLLRLPVRVRGIDVGHAVDLIVDPEHRRVLGFDVLCRDDEHRFLPLSVADIGDGEIGVPSALTLLAEDELAFYRRRASTMRLLRGADVRNGARRLGVLEDVVVDAGGAISGLVVSNGKTKTTVDAAATTIVRRDASAA
jgi:uncharacterized protein YrrD